MRENPSGDFKKMYRHISKGGWPFSMQDHGWQVSDCTSEGLKVILRITIKEIFSDNNFFIVIVVKSTIVFRIAKLFSDIHIKC